MSLSTYIRIAFLPTDVGTLNTKLSYIAYYIQFWVKHEDASKRLQEGLSSVTGSLRSYRSVSCVSNSARFF